MAKRLTPARAERAIGDLARLEVASYSHTSLLRSAWQLQHSLTAYDAFYVALAVEAGATLVTIDAKLTRSPVVRCDVELLVGSL